MSAVAERAAQPGEELRHPGRAVPPGGADHAGPVPQPAKGGARGTGAGQVAARAQP